MTAARPDKAKAKPDPPTSQIEVKLREAIRDPKVNIFHVAKKADVHPTMIHRFLNADRGLTLASAGRLAEALGYELAVKVEPKRRRRKEAAATEGG